MKVYEIRIRVYILENIPYQKMLSQEAHFIDSALARDKNWLEYHKERQYKIYTITMRTMDAELAKYLTRVLRNHYTRAMKGLTLETRIIPKKIISELYTLTPVLQKTEVGYWRNQMSLGEFERHLFENAVKKYNSYTEKKMDEDFQLYTGITFLNKKPIANQYKEITLLGDKIHLSIADNEQAQELAYFLTGSGIGEMNSRGYGYCNYRWL